jgi:hypothetical protein
MVGFQNPEYQWLKRMENGKFLKLMLLFNNNEQPTRVLRQAG